MSVMVAARPKQRIFAGTPEQVACVRDFTRRMLAGCPVVDDAVLLTSELATNAIVHTASGTGGVFTVVIERAQTWVAIEVYDCGSEKAPTAGKGGEAAESGRGLGVVAALAKRWGHEGGPDGRIVWFELEWQ